jgi:hypothetical protein
MKRDCRDRGSGFRLYGVGGNESEGEEGTVMKNSSIGYEGSCFVWDI